MENNQISTTAQTLEESKSTNLLDENNEKDNVLNESDENENSVTIIQNSVDYILEELIKNIQLVDFEVLVYPEIEMIKKEMQILKPLVSSTDAEQYKKLSKKLSSFKLSKNHYLILCIEELIKIVNKNNWGLCKKNGFIYLYNGCFWTLVDKDRFQFFLGDVALKMGVEKFKGKIHTFKEDLYKQFMSDAFLSTPNTNDDRVLINLINGTFEISASKRILRNFDRSDFLTHQLKFEYDSTATAPQWIKFLDEVLPDKDKQKVFAEYLGYIFIKTSALKLEKLLLLFGTGANGKSVCFEVVMALLGRENMSSYSLQNLTDLTGYYRAKIIDKLVNYTSEISGKLETDIFKQIASGEPIEIRLPYGEPAIMYNYAKMIFNCNELPKSTESTNAFFRRFLILDFDVTIPEKNQDKNLANKIIKDELSGIFNWILEGLERLLKQGNFSSCKAIDDARTNYEKQVDSISLFLSENGYVNALTDYLLISDLYLDYKKFCFDDGYIPVKKTNFKNQLEDKHKVQIARKSKGFVAFLKL